MASIKGRYFKLALLLLWQVSASQALAWRQPQIIGSVEESLLPEASGIASSTLIPHRLYHINDSGNFPKLTITGLHGENAKSIPILGAQITDTEDLAIASCPDTGSCLYIADTGDNAENRSDVALLLIREQAEFQDEVGVDFQIYLDYPDGHAHNVESLAFYKNKSGYLLTKEMPAILYHFEIPRLLQGEEAHVELKALGTLDLSQWVKDFSNVKDQVATGMAFRSDGQQMIVLTRSAAIAIDWDLEKELGSFDLRSRVNLNRLIEKKNRKVSRLPFLKVPQSEAITYIDGGPSLLYSTESSKKLNGLVPLVEIPAN